MAGVYFSHRAKPGVPNELTWRISGNSLEALADNGVDVSEEMLRGQLIRAIAEANTVDAAGAGSTPGDRRRRNQQRVN